MDDGRGSRRPIGDRLRIGATLLAAAALAAATAACGQQDADATDRAAATVQTLLDACEQEQGEVALQLLTPPVRAELLDAGSVRAGCEQVLELVEDGEVPDFVLRRSFAETTLEAIEVDAGFGRATLRSADGTTSDVELEDAEGRWLIANPAP